MAQYGEVRVDYLTYTTGVSPSEGSATTTISGLVNSPTFSGDVNVEGNLVVNNSLTVSGDIIASGVTISGITGLFASGIETAPSIAFVDDTNTGFYNSATNEIRIVTNGTDQLTIKNDGNVGIGTTSPGTLLHLSSDTGSASPTPTELRIATTTTANDWSLIDPWGRISFYSADPGGSGPKIHATIDCVSDASSGASSNLFFNTSSNSADTLTTRLMVEGDSGNVGIGTTSPTTTLDVRSNNPAFRLWDTDVTNSYTQINNFNGNTYLGSRADTANGSLLFGGYGSGTFDEHVRITPDGKLGVGTSSPSVALAIVGTANQTWTNNPFNVEISDDRAFAAGVGGGISFKAKINTAGSYSNIGFISGIKENATEGNYAGALVLGTRVNGSGGGSMERVRITSTGNVGIGTTNPVDGKLEIFHTGFQVALKTSGATGNLGIGMFSNGGFVGTRGNNGGAEDVMRLGTSGQERLRIGSAGRLLVGTSTAIATVDHLNAGFTPQTQVANQGGISSALLLANFRNNNSVVPQLVLQKARGDFASPVIVNNNDTFGAIDFNGYDGSSYLAGAIIKAEVDGPPGTNDMPGRLVFSTTADGASTPTERMRIDSSGNATFAGNITVPSLNDGPLAGFRNQLINSSFLFDQYRNLEIDANGNTLGEGDFACDRWIVSGDPGGNWQNVTRTNRNITGVSTSGIGLRFNDVNNTTTAKRLLQAIELTNQGKNSQFVVGSTWTLSFWCDSDLSSTAVNSPVFRKVSTTSTDQVAISSTPPSNYTVGRTVDGFTHYSATFTVDNSVTSSADAANITCLSVLINLPPQTNSVIVAPQFEPGPVATPFEYRPFTTELVLCQRYYQVIRSGGKTGASIPRPSSGQKVLFMNVVPTIPVRDLSQFTVTSPSIYTSANGDSTNANGISSFSAGLSLNKAAKAGITYDSASSISTAYGYQFTVTWDCEL